MPAKHKQCLQNANETILHLKLWQNASKVQFLLHNEQQTPAKCKQTQIMQTKCWQNACIMPAKHKQCLQNANETILHLNKLWQNASKVQFLLHNEQQAPAKCKQTQIMQTKCWQNACIMPAKHKQCLQNANETILHLNKHWQNASKVQFLLHNEQQTPAKCKQTQLMQTKCWQSLIIIILLK